MAIPLNQEIKFSLNKILVNELNAAMLSLDMPSQRLDEACFDSFIAGEHLSKSFVLLFSINELILVINDYLLVLGGYRMGFIVTGARQKA